MPSVHILGLYCKVKCLLFFQGICITIIALLGYTHAYYNDYANICIACSIFRCTIVKLVECKADTV